MTSTTSVGDLQAEGDLHVEHGPACARSAARYKRSKARKRRPKAKMQQDGAALGQALGMTIQLDGDPHWQRGASLNPETDPEGWWINDLFERYADEIRRASRHAFEGYDQEDWLMSLILRLVAEQPTSLVPFADDEGFYNQRNWGQGKIRQPDDVGKWLKTVLYNALRNAVRDQRLHREILAKAVLEPNHWRPSVCGGDQTRHGPGR